MRIVVDGLAARTGGGITYLRTMLAGALEADQELEITLVVSDPAPFAGLRSDGRLRVVAPLGEAPSLRRRLCWELVSLGPYAAAAKADVVFSPSEIGPWRSAVPVVLGFQNPNLWERPLPLPVGQRLRFAALRALGRASAQRAAALLFVSAHLRAAAALSASVQEVVSPGLDPVFFEPASVNARFAELRPYVLTVGDLYAYKNLRRLVAAFARIAPERPDLRLVVAGRAVGRSEADRVLEDAARLGVGRSVVLTGPVALDEMPGLYKGAEAFVFASLLESFGFPPLEAMACGVPVACARASVMPSVLGDAPVWFDPLDIADMAAALARVVGDPAVARAAVERGKAQAQRYNREAAGAALVRLLAGVAAYHRRS